MLAACSSNPVKPTSSPALPAEVTVTSTPAPPALQAACSEYQSAFQRFIDASGDAGDDQYAADLEQIAGTSAKGTALVAPLRQMAHELRAHDVEVEGRDVI